MSGGMSRLLAVALAAGLAIAAGASLAQVNGPEGSTLHACMSKTTGMMRLADSPSQCTRYETAVSWVSYQAENLDDTYVNEGQADSIDSGMIVDGEVKTNDLADNSVTTDKILDGTIGVADLGPNSVTREKIAANAVGSDQIATGAVGSDEIADGTVGSAEIGTDAVGSDEIATDAVGSDELAPDSVESGHIENFTIQQDDLSQALQNHIADQNGLATYQIVPGEEVVVEANSANVLDVSCPSTSQRVVGGGINTNRTDVSIFRSYPLNSITWRIGVSNYAGLMWNEGGTAAEPGPVTVQPYAICVE